LFDVSERANDQASAERRVKDELLQGVAETLVRAIRQSDLPIHWSGNELLLVLPGLAGAEARAVAERVRAAMQAGGRHRVAVAGGVAELDTDEQFGSVVRRARAKLAEALARGHNRVS
jgi:diguanylate cyclase (GGDEF)-like protein